MSEDKEIKDLFTAMKQNDLEATEVPAFDTLVPTQQKQSFKPWMYAAAAVATLLLGWFTLFQSPVDTGATEDFDLSLDFVESEETDPLLAENQSMYDWEAQTDILIKEFDE